MVYSRYLVLVVKKNGKEIHVRSIFLQGLFFMDTEKLPDKLITLKDTLIELHRKASNSDLDMASLALNFCLQNNDIDGVLIGVENATQLSENMESLQDHISNEIMREILDIRVTDPSLLNPVNWQ